MIPTFVITLREGVEASLIVGIIAAFLVKEGRQDALRQMWVGVAIAIVLCTAVGIGLDVVGEELPQQQQEGLETIVGLIAVATISYMIIWMTRHSREIKAELEGEAASALARGSAMALVGMAFLAVLREGFETSVFLLAAFQDATNTTAAGAGAVLGLLCAVVIGVGLYRGGVHINLSKFFKITGAGAGLRRRRPARHRRPHRPRGGLDLQLPDPKRSACAGWSTRAPSPNRCSPGCSACAPRRPRSRPSSTWPTRSRWRSSYSGRAAAAGPARQRPPSRGVGAAQTPA